MAITVDGTTGVSPLQTSATPFLVGKYNGSRWIII